jgi:hypothetical protein
MPAHTISYQFHILKKLDMIKLMVENIDNENHNSHTHTANKEEYADNYTTEYCLLLTLKKRISIHFISSKNNEKPLPV